MKLYTCSKCRNLLYFENTVCLNCGSPVGFEAGSLSMKTLSAAGNQDFSDLTDPKQQWRYCENAQYAACNWLIPAAQGSLFCVACGLNRMIPYLENMNNLRRWRLIEVAKHRLVYSLLRLQLPVKAKHPGESEGITFDFLADLSPLNRVMTGHDNGTITLNIEEADEALRVRHKLDLGEKYRTLLGHFRHEIGHYYWDVFFKNDAIFSADFRKLFGDERAEYNKALEQYYAVGAPSDWNKSFISPYAAAHPWEDWAETWSHYLHMLDTLETAYSFGIAVHPRKPDAEQETQVTISRDPYSIDSFDDVLALWLPLTFAVNSLNRSMGHPDFYPFIISTAVKDKLKFIHQCVKKFSPTASRLSAQPVDYETAGQ